MLYAPGCIVLQLTRFDTVLKVKFSYSEFSQLDSALLIWYFSTSHAHCFFHHSTTITKLSYQLFIFRNNHNSRRVAKLLGLNMKVSIKLPQLFQFCWNCGKKINVIAANQKDHSILTEMTFDTHRKCNCWCWCRGGFGIKGSSLEITLPFAP